MFDCIALALNEAFDLGFPERDAKFQRPDFRRILSEKVESVNSFAISEGTYELISMISKLRNTIHQEPTSLATISDFRQFVLMAKAESDSIKKVSDRFGLSSAIHGEDRDGQLFLVPVKFIELVFPILVRHANGLIENARWPRSSTPPPAFTSTPGGNLFIGDAQRIHLLFGF